MVCVAQLPAQVEEGCGVVPELIVSATACAFCCVTLNNDAF